MVTIRKDGIDANLTKGVWTCATPWAEALLNAYTVFAAQDMPHGVDPDNEIAARIAGEMGAEIVQMNPEQKEEDGPRY